ncbi:hypothetical protein QCA50_002283 [Cerrena zonata]|uniref:Uncharacterized protein n=1 Tax=Cerrena zonata TaxID=2478898 RepID=A0AAW0GNY3_9APHY
MEATSSPIGALFPLFVILSILLFAALGWCLLSSCMGRSLRDAISDLWETLLLSAQAGDRTSQQWRRRHDWNEMEYEMDHRGRGRVG